MNFLTANALFSIFSVVRGQLIVYPVNEPFAPGSRKISTGIRRPAGQ
jgi:hypothetical protein